MTSPAVLTAYLCRQCCFIDGFGEFGERKFSFAKNLDTDSHGCGCVSVTVITKILEKFLRSLVIRVKESAVIIVTQLVPVGNSLCCICYCLLLYAVQDVVGKVLIEFLLGYGKLFVKMQH